MVPRMLCEVVINSKVVGILFSCLIKIRQSGFQNHPPGGLFFLVRLRNTGEPQRTNELWQSQTLQDEGDQDHAERQENDEIALCEGSPIAQGLRKCDSRSQRDYPSHPGPADYEHSPEAGHRFFMVQSVLPDKVRKPSARIDPDQT